MNRYALIDTAATPDVPRALRYYTEGHLARSLFDTQPEWQQADAGPWLAVLDGNDPLRNWLPALDLHEGAMAWLESDRPFIQVFTHLQQHLDVRLPDGKLGMLRFWDGRVLWWLQSVLTPVQRQTLLGPIGSWKTQLAGRLFDFAPGMANRAET